MVVESMSSKTQEVWSCDHCKEEVGNTDKGLIRIAPVRGTTPSVAIKRRHHKAIEGPAATFHIFTGDFCSRKCLQAAADLWLAELMHLAKDDA
jgi:hypothetical protein